MHAVQKILIVDDELMMRMLLKQVIERSSLRDVSVSVAEDGEEALIKVEQEHPDLILLDVLLPKMNGYDVCQRIRRLSNYNPHSTPVQLQSLHHHPDSTWEPD